MVDFTGHVQIRMDGLSAAILTDAEYPQRVAFSILGKILDEFSAKFPTRDITPATTSSKYPQLRDHLVKAQDPQSTDPFMKVRTIHLTGYTGFSPAIS
jgi:synaptobrevin family protein YKT6